MKNLAKVLLVVGAVGLGAGILSRLINTPVIGSKPVAIFSFADTCLLLAIGLLLLEEKK
ncbi:MAG: hypothetical protein NC928_05800 [Candidatus Omnitrophica bacterium]|nr:hypothetical protein [Candidatus Omnitrophota bacterium]